MFPTTRGIVDSGSDIYHMPAYTRAVPVCAASLRYDSVKNDACQTLVPERVMRLAILPARSTPETLAFASETLLLAIVALMPKARSCLAWRADRVI